MLFNSLAKLCSRDSFANVGQLSSFSFVFTRNLMKTHKGTAKRWKKTADGFKRGKAGRNHGNVGWSRRSLKVLSGKTPAHDSHMQRLKRLLPY